MTRKTILLVIFTMAMTSDGPARAFCIENKSPWALRVHLETSNPFGTFAVLFKPGDRGCCAWFNPRCNPTRDRQGVLMFSVRSKHRGISQRYCSSGWMRGAFATADGNILITENKTSRGGLDCDSRDKMQRPVTHETFVKNSMKKRGLPPPIIVPPPPEHGSSSLPSDWDTR